MIEAVRFLRSLEPFRAGEFLELKPPVTFVCADRGSAGASFVEAIRAYARGARGDLVVSLGGVALDKIASRCPPSDDYQSALLALTAPDAGLHLAEATALLRRIQAAAMRGNQVIAAVSHPWLIAAVPEVLDLSARRWVPSAEYLRLCAETPRSRGAR
jgi:predicted ATPase